MDRALKCLPAACCVALLCGQLAGAAEGTAANAPGSEARDAGSAAAGAADASAAAAPAGEGETAPVRRDKRLLEPRSGVEFRLDARWRTAADDATRGLAWLLDGDAGHGALLLRFPLHYDHPPDSAEAAFDLDEQQADQQPDAQPKGLKSVDNPKPEPAIGSGLALLEHSFRYERGRKRFLRQQYYLTTPESQVVAVTCTLPESELGEHDACREFVSSAAMMPTRERNDRLALVERQEQRDPNTDRLKVSCRTIDEEVGTWRTEHPNARLEQMPRFASLYSELMVKAFVGGNNRAIAAASQSNAAYIERIAATCAARPDGTYGDAIESAK